MAAPIIKTDVNALAKVTSLGARFFEKFVTTTRMNKVITNMNAVGLVDMVVCVTGDATTDFTMLKVGDYVVQVKVGLGTSMYHIIATAGTLPVAGVATDLYIVIRPSM